MKNSILFLAKKKATPSYDDDDDTSYDQPIPCKCTFMRIKKKTYITNLCEPCQIELEKWTDWVDLIKNN